MLTEISLNILDIVHNSIRASATLIEITIEIMQNKNLLRVSIKDNGHGMDTVELKHAEDPFFTTRTTRSVGLGISFFKCASELTGGTFKINSAKGVGTEINADFTLSHVDRMPLGDITSTIHSLITSYTEIDFFYKYSFNNGTFILDTREMRNSLGDIPFYTPEISNFIKEYLEENKKEIDGGISI